MKIKTININRLKRVKPGELRITPIDNRFYSNAPFINSKTNLPQWFRRVHKGDGSIRACSGVSDFLEFGITIPAWSNLKFKPLTEIGIWEIDVDQFNPPLNYIPSGGFHFGQTGSCPMTEARKIEKMSYPKIHTPWRIQTAPGWSCLMIPAYYEENANFSILPAIVNTDYYQIMNIVFNVKTDSEFTVKQGTPLVHIIPIQRKTNVRHIDFIDESFFKYASSNAYMTGGTVPHNGGTGIAYRKAVRVVDETLKENSIRKKLWFKK